MKSIRPWGAGPNVPTDIRKMKAFTWEEIKEKYNNRWSFGLDSLLRFGYIQYQGWVHVFQDPGELKHYLYWSSCGAGHAWAPNAKLLEKALGHKVYRAFDLNRKYR